MPAPPVKLNIERRTALRVSKTKQTPVDIPAYDGFRYIKLPIDDPYIAPQVIDPDPRIRPLPISPEQPVLIPKPLAGVHLVEPSDTLTQPRPLTFSWQDTVPNPGNTIFTTPNLTGQFHLNSLVIYFADAGLQSFAWSMVSSSTPPLTFAQFIACNRLQPSETPLAAAGDQLGFDLASGHLQTIPLNQSIGLQGQQISINITSIGVAAANDASVHLTLQEFTA